MSLTTSQRRSVAFIGSFESDGRRRLRGTGFFVAVPAPTDGIHLYLVSAAHVIPYSEEVFMRLRRLDAPAPRDDPLVKSALQESVVDVTVPKWHRHWSADLAVALLSDTDSQWAIGVVPLDEFVDASQHAPALGEPVFFAGLLGQVDSMGERHVPMLRGGIIGELHQTDIPILEPGGSRRALHGHLIDCHSFGGFSGSPCFVRMLRAGQPTPRLHLATTESHSPLLGLVGGHFDHRASVEIAGERYSIPSSAGIAVVYPCEQIRELIDDEDVIAERQGA